MYIPTIAAPNAALPKPTTPGSAGADLSAIHECSIAPGACKLVKTGLSMAIPEGYAGFVCSRSGLALKNQVFVLNAPGIIDSSYRGDVGVILFNAGDRHFDIFVGDRVAQLLIVRAEAAVFQQVESLDATERGEGGFGSTGVGKFDCMDSVNTVQGAWHARNNVPEFLKKAKS